MKKISGNALWFILLGIFLLGGLTVLLSRTGNQSEETGSTEQVSIQASEILRYAGGLTAGISSLLSRGCSENQINFHHADETTNYVNPNAPPDGSCDLFDVRGAGVPFLKKKESWLANVPANYYWNLFATQCLYGIGKGTTTCTASESDMIVLAGSLKKEICIEINRILGVTNPSGNPPIDDIDGPSFTGSFSVTGTLNDDILGDSATLTALPLQNRKAACLQDIDTSRYNFYEVVLSR